MSSNAASQPKNEADAEERGGEKSLTVSCGHGNPALREPHWTFQFKLVLVAQLCLILSDPLDCSPPGFSVHEILQARILEWIVICFFRDLPEPGIEPRSLALQAISLLSELAGKL